MRRKSSFLLSALTLFLYPMRELNPHDHYWPQDFKSCVSTSSTTRASVARLDLSRRERSESRRARACRDGCHRGTAKSTTPNLVPQKNRNPFPPASGKGFGPSGKRDS